MRSQVQESGRKTLHARDGHILPGVRHIMHQDGDLTPSGLGGSRNELLHPFLVFSCVQGFLQEAPDCSRILIG